MTDTQAVEDMAEIRRRVEAMEVAILRTLNLMEMMVCWTSARPRLCYHPQVDGMILPSNLKGKCHEQLEQTDQAVGEIHFD